MSAAKFRVGDRVWVTQGRSQPPLFRAAEVIRTPGVPPAMGRMLVRYLDDGRDEDTHVHNCHHDSAAWQAWHRALARKAELGAELIALCRRKGLVFGGEAARSLPQWGAYSAADEEVRRTGAAAFAVHPYPRA